MKRLILTFVALCLIASVTLAVKEGPVENWWWIGASILDDYSGDAPLVIEINGNPSAGQAFCPGEAITITCDLHSYAVASTSWSNGAYLEWALAVGGDSDADSIFNWSDTSHAEAEKDAILSITPVLPVGVYTVTMNSNAQAAAWLGSTVYVEESETATAELTFAVACIDKVKTSGPEEIGIYLPEATPYTFEIHYSGPAARIIDTVPAEFEVINADPAVATSANKGNKENKSATIITWDVDAGLDQILTVIIQTRESPGEGHKKKGDPAPLVFKPTSCGPLPINDGATAYEVDEQGVPVLDGDGNMIPIVGPSNALVVDAVAGDKPCVEVEDVD